MRFYMEADRIKHLEFLQDNIQRMNQCSFQMKGWTITIVAALIAVYVAQMQIAINNGERILLIAILPTIMFWFLDSFYLSKERNLITTYNIVAGVKDVGIEVKTFEISPELGEFKANFWSVMISPSERRFYLSVIVILLLSICLIHK